MSEKPIIRLFCQTNPDLQLAGKLLLWLQNQWGEPVVSLPDIYHYHHMPRFCMPGPHAYCTRTPSIRPVWIGVRQLAVQRVWV
jgi:hypothetical protein